MTNVINSFTVRVDGAWVHSPLSNFYVEPDGTNVESEFQSLKTIDRVLRQRIRSLPPGEAKKAGRAVDLRPDWEQIKVPAMAHFVTKKFREHQALSAYLLDTVDAMLIEGNTWHDNFWGDCSCPRCMNPGQNTLGVILMTVRTSLGYVSRNPMGQVI